MNYYYELLLKIENAYIGKHPPILYPENKTAVSGFILKIPADKLKYLEQKGMIEILYFPKLNYKKAKITEKGKRYIQYCAMKKE